MEYTKWYEYYCHKCGYGTNNIKITPNCKKCGETYFKYYCYQCKQGTNNRDLNCKKCNKYMFPRDYGRYTVTYH